MDYPTNIKGVRPRNLSMLAILSLAVICVIGVLTKADEHNGPIPIPPGTDFDIAAICAKPNHMLTMWERHLCAAYIKPVNGLHAAAPTC